jgi:hypothetical protein
MIASRARWCKTYPSLLWYHDRDRSIDHRQQIEDIKACPGFPLTDQRVSILPGWDDEVASSKSLSLILVTELLRRSRPTCVRRSS